MDKSLQLFNFNENDVRTFLDENDNIWFCLKDVCDILDIGNVSQLLKRLDEGGVIINEVTSENNSKSKFSRKTQKMNFINESNLYRVILSSNKPIAKKFDKWVFNEVIPNIRQKGAYIQPNLSDEQYIIVMKDLTSRLEKAVEDRKKLETENKILLPKAEFYDTVTQSDNWTSIGKVSKVLSIPKLGRNNLFKKLREMEILNPENEPYQQFIELGYFKIVEEKYEKSDGNVDIYFKTVVSQKGIDYIRKKLA